MTAPCDHMIETDPPFCYQGRHIPRDCGLCAKYVADGKPTLLRIDVWADIRQAVAATPAQVPDLVAERGVDE